MNTFNTIPSYDYLNKNIWINHVNMDNNINNFTIYNAKMSINNLNKNNLNNNNNDYNDIIIKIGSNPIGIVNLNNNNIWSNFNVNTNNNINKLNDNAKINFNNLNNNNSNINNDIMMRIYKKPCGIINYKNNCYLNSGLQILATCDKFVKELEKYKEIKTGLIFLINDAFYKLLNEPIYDPKNFLIYFCSLNNENIGSQYCSQNFIRTILKNINNELIKIENKTLNGKFNQDIQYKPQNKIEFQKYYKYMESNRYFPECKAFNLFSGISKFYSYGKCQNCGENIEDYSFSYFIDQNIYIDNNYKNYDFSSLLLENLGNTNNLNMNCPKCNIEINIKEEMKFIKIPEILIFTLERYKEGINNILIKPDDTIDLTNYIDNSIRLTNTKYIYELFAINIRFGNTNDFGHEICQVKRNDVWYEINDIIANKRSNTYNGNSYGLFYKRK